MAVELGGVVKANERMKVNQVDKCECDQHVGFQKDGGEVILSRYVSRDEYNMTLF